MEYSPFLKDEPFIITVAGSHQECGKSFVSVNMAIQCAQAGMKVLLVDHDLGELNMQALYDMSKSDNSQSSGNSKMSLQLFLLEEGIPNLLMIPGSNFDLDSTNISKFNKTKFFNKIKEISSADIVIIDIGNREIEHALDIFLMAHAGIMVATTDASSIVNAYEFFKNAVYRTVFRMFRGQGDMKTLVKNILADAVEGQSHTIQQLAHTLEKENPWMAKILLEVCNSFDFYLILNKAKNPQEFAMGEKLQALSNKLLNIKINFPGLLYFDPEVLARSNEAAPLSVTQPKSTTCQTIHHMTSFIINNMIMHNIYSEPAADFKQQIEEVRNQAYKDYASLQKTTPVT